MHNVDDMRASPTIFPGRNTQMVKSLWRL